MTGAGAALDGPRRRPSPDPGRQAPCFRMSSNASSASGRSNGRAYPAACRQRRGDTPQAAVNARDSAAALP